MDKKITKRPVVFLAPGAGLGHIVRASAIADCLEEKSIPCLIITSSLWAEALSRITGIASARIPPDKWGKDLAIFLEKIKPCVIVQDSFPFGFKNENLEAIARKIPFIYLARYLKIEAYFKAINKKWDKNSALISTIIKIEALSEIHNNLIADSLSDYTSLKKRIVFPFEKFRQAIPSELKTKLKSKRLHLVVHSGPYHETESLVKKAMENIQEESQGELGIISPVFVQRKMKNAYDYFPAAALFADAYRIYTGGGYNAIAETQPFYKKIRPIAFPRYYDDQKNRIAECKNKRNASTENYSGALDTAEIIASQLYDLYG